MEINALNSFHFEMGWHVQPGSLDRTVFIRRACQPLAESCLHTADRSMQRFVRLVAEQGFMRVRALADGERVFFQNLNEPGDLPAAE